jgi:hypothetical protein
MAEIRTATTLKRKAREIRASIAAYERKLRQARADLSHVTAAIAIFEGSGDTPKPYVDVYRLFAHRELIGLCIETLTAKGPMDTRELTLAVMKRKRLDTGDKVLAKAIAYRMIHALRMQCHRGKIADAGKRRNVRIWAMPCASSGAGNSR